MCEQDNSHKRCVAFFFIFALFFLSKAMSSGIDQMLLPRLQRAWRFQKIGRNFFFKEVSGKILISFSCSFDLLLFGFAIFAPSGLGFWNRPLLIFRLHWLLYWLLTATLFSNFIFLLLFAAILALHLKRWSCWKLAWSAFVQLCHFFPRSLCIFRSLWRKEGEKEVGEGDESFSSFLDCAFR